MREFGELHWTIEHRPEQHKVDAAIHCKELAFIFRELMGEVTSYTKRIPKWLKHISAEMDAELLYGIALADGSYRRKKDRKGEYVPQKR